MKLRIAPTKLSSNQPSNFGNSAARSFLLTQRMCKTTNRSLPSFRNIQAVYRHCQWRRSQINRLNDDGDDGLLPHAMNGSALDRICLSLSRAAASVWRVWICFLVLFLVTNGTRLAQDAMETSLMDQCLNENTFFLWNICWLLIWTKMDEIFVSWAPKKKFSCEHLWFLNINLLTKALQETLRI